MKIADRRLSLKHVSFVGALVLAGTFAFAGAQPASAMLAADGLAANAQLAHTNALAGEAAGVTKVKRRRRHHRRHRRHRHRRYHRRHRHNFGPIYWGGYPYYGHRRHHHHHPLFGIGVWPGIGFSIF